MPIPDASHGIALQAVASGDDRTITATAMQLGLSAPALAQACVHLIDDPKVVAAHPRPCRVIAERIERGRRKRDAGQLVVRSEV
ncbi:hypothetical protein J4N02_13355 [Propioniciclava sp. MC1595]|uniref:hypothetical protein n=1 Tax=unclassified Propioniciclava TaxID=2642922 RepID=UPI001602C196|nr:MULTISPECIES: hypothetical protein [unclassified Propioniciclava]MBB1494111.1 hypothetical protein [Propioniciclava sp. MC1595]MBB1502940.1 hypothetical protein [Propioniciclava sp. MC1683]QTE25477.1 hypothetical protein J4N02_13355 [Propioniciclava sp. MC1595]